MRHGETEWNRQQRVMGTEDIGLNSNGQRQCELAAQALGAMGIERIVTSPLRRAIESADIVSARLGLPIERSSALEEVRFGDWQGLTYEAVSSDPRYIAFSENPEARPTPGGETIRDVQRRGLEGLAEITGSETVLVISHGDIIRSILCFFLGISVRDFRRLRVDNAGLSAVTTEAAGVQVRFLNLLVDSERAWDSVHWRGSEQRLP